MKVEGAVKAVLREANVDYVVVGISGGADSTALLLALVSAGIKMECVHCNFHLRGEESMRDQRWVENLCSRLGLNLRIIDFDVEEYCRTHSGISIEMACRELRYSYFREVIAESGAKRIAVAHNADDNIETLLLNLFRGSGVKGLRGMVADTGEIIRPLLEVSRQDIERYLEIKQEGYVVDSSNLESDYRRNFIRNEIIPALETRWPGVRKALSTTTANLRSEEKVLDWAESQIIPNGNQLPLVTIEESPDPFWTIYHFAAKWGASRKIVMEMLDVYQKKHGSQLIVGKCWNIDQGRFVYSMRALKFLPNCFEQKANGGVDSVKE